MALITCPKLSSCLFSDPTIRRAPTIRITSTLKTVSSSISSNHQKNSKRIVPDLLENSGFCSCCHRRQFFGSILGTGLLPVLPSFASGDDSSPQDDMEVLNIIRPPRPDWYEELYALAMDKLTKAYEAEIAGYKSRLFASLKGKADKILEIGVGTGPNLKYYADYPGVNVIGVDPNRKMEKYAQVAAENAGLKPANFKFMQAVAEALPLKDASVDAVVGTLVLCSVEDVDKALKEIRRVLKPGGFYIFVEHVAAKDGTILRFVQRILDPLQQTVADGCHLTRNTANNIATTGFASVDVNQVVLSTASIINPHIYGVAYK
ncbi:methyltransferase-like protein 7a [Phtheirospermum japonicum]|uniref:Methyltransferase-like protein 7a n=1 Tax=Phtheirospermum japonicum TaxID=374723 RepID=A0A830CTS0_9LAMI|nr:methyltransferase-like protein 7a [Phtheirospermum japonicum]